MGVKMPSDHHMHHIPFINRVLYSVPVLGPEDWVTLDILKLTSFIGKEIKTHDDPIA
jgi:hypothetical protein